MGFFKFKYYDDLVKVVYGNSFYQFQANLINAQKADSVLIVGPGKGQLLEFLSKSKKYTLVEKSTVFVSLMKNQSNMEVNNIDFFDWKPNEKFDLVVYPFFLDLFDEVGQQKVINKSLGLLSKNGKILVIDFDQPKTFFERLHIRFLYFTFRLLDGIKGKKLSEINYNMLKVLKNIKGPNNFFFAIKATIVRRSK